MIRSCSNLTSVCPCEDGRCIVTETAASISRPPFVIHEYFLETAFEQRFQGLLRDAWKNRSWHVIAAIPGSGKSLGIADLVQQYASYKESKKITKIPPACDSCAKEWGQGTSVGNGFLDGLWRGSQYALAHPMLLPG